MTPVATMHIDELNMKFECDETWEDFESSGGNADDPVSTTGVTF